MVNAGHGGGGSVGQIISISTNEVCISEGRRRGRETERERMREGEVEREVERECVRAADSGSHLRYAQNKSSPAFSFTSSEYSAEVTCDRDRDRKRQRHR